MRKRFGFVIYSHFKGSIFTAVKRDAKFYNRYHLFLAKVVDFVACAADRKRSAILLWSYSQTPFNVNTRSCETLFFPNEEKVILANAGT